MMVRGDLKPDLMIQVADARSDADFSNLTAANCRVVCVMNGRTVVDDTVDTITIAADGKSAILSRAWELGETDTAGKMYIRAVIEWPGSKPQSFPDDTFLVLPIRAANDDQ